jgi:protein gp37
MADVLGQWVPAEWIEAVLQVIRSNKQWNFLCLTKFPQRAIEFDLPANLWMGTTVDSQARVENAERAFAKIKSKVKWLSCEPLLEPLKFKNLEVFNWIVIGGASESVKTPDWVPNIDWIVDLHTQARKAKLAIYYKTNCGIEDSLRIKEYPWIKSQQKSLPKAFRYLKGM